MDLEFRVLMSGGGRHPEDLIMWSCAPDGQWGLVDGMEVGPFDTRQDVVLKITRWMMRAWADGAAAFELK